MVYAPGKYKAPGKLFDIKCLRNSKPVADKPWLLYCSNLILKGGERINEG